MRNNGNHNGHHIGILVVDDSPMVLSFAKRVLEDLRIPIRTANNGQDGLALMTSDPADILITDIMMPIMSGFDLISEVRRDERLSRSYIIVMTALDQVRDKVRALELGANDYTVKPLDAAEFRARVQSALREITLKKQLTHALSTLDQELALVGQLQKRFLPAVLPQNEHFQSGVLYQPWSRAGGDYYDLFKDRQGRLVLTVADVSGHGASAAVLMAVLRALLKVFVGQGGSAKDIVLRLNDALRDNIGNHPDFVSLFLGISDLDGRRLNFCNAGHGDMILLGPEKGRLRKLPSGGTVLGFIESEWNEEWLTVEPGQSLFLYTDGLIEAVNRDGEEFGRARLEKLLKSADPEAHPGDLVRLIQDEVDVFTQNAEFSDDLTLFVIKFQ